MARIRTVKPSFFRHESLQDLEAAHPKKYPMLVFAGLWGHCDRYGRFEWRPRMLKLDILPFLNFEMADTLKILEDHGFVRRYGVEGKEYGVIDTFLEHQRINGKEAQEEEKYPEPPEKQQGSTGEATGKQLGRQEGKGREGNKEGNGDVPGEAVASSTLEGVVEEWNSYNGLVRIQQVTGPIRDRINARLKEKPSMEWWRNLFQRVSQSDFLTGRKTDFMATLDWVLGPKNLAKILAGNYDNRQATVLKTVPKSMVDLL